MDRRRRVRAGGTPADPFDRACRPPAPGRGRGRALPARDRAGLGGGPARASGIDPGAERAPLASQPARGRCLRLDRGRAAPRARVRDRARRVCSGHARPPQTDGDPVVATFGLSPEESSRELLGLPPGGGKARAVALAYRYSEEEAARDEFRLSGGLALPVLDRDGGRLGTLAVFSRRVEREVTEEELERLEGLAGRSAPRCATHSASRSSAEPSTGTSLGSWAGARSAKPRRRVRAGAPLCASAQPASPSRDRRAGERQGGGGPAPGGVRTPDRVHHLGDGRFAVVLPSRRSATPSASRAGSASRSAKAGRPPRSSSFASRTTPSRCSSAASPRSPVQRPSPRLAETCQGC